MSFLSADFAAVEARVVNWLAGQEDALARFRAYDCAKTKEEKHALDPYRIMASHIYSIPVERVNKFPQRFVGKGCELGAGFGLGPPKFRVNCKTVGGYDLPEGLEFKAIKAWRTTHKKVVGFWYELEGAAKRAILYKGEAFAAGQHIKFQCRDIVGMAFLLMRLPSGRKLSYPKPRISGDRITFFGNVKGTTWGDVSIWGGVLANNCLAGDTQVLSHRRGWVNLSTITIQDRVWDGVEFVEHQGLLNKGQQQVINFHRMRVTPDHLFLGEESWVSAQTACANPNIKLYSPHERSLNSSYVAASRPLRAEVWSFDRCVERTRNWEENHLGLPLRVRKNSYQNWMRSSPQNKTCDGVRKKMPNHSERYWESTDYAWNEQAPRTSRSISNACPMLKPQTPSVAQLWRERNQRMREMVGVFREFLGGHGANLSKRNGHRPSRQRQRLHSRELQVGYSQTQFSQSKMHVETRGGATGFLGRSGGSRDQTQHALLSFESRVDVGTDHQHSAGFSEQVYDLLNCGPRHQFVVRSKHESGRLLIAHNCTQGTAMDIMANGAHKAEAKGYPICTLIHDEAISYFREEQRAAGLTAKGFSDCLTDLPAWAAGLPIATDFGEIPFYLKD